MIDINSFDRGFNKLHSDDPHDYMSHFFENNFLNRIRKPNMCGSWSVRKIESGQRTHFFRVNCKLWNCPRCGPKKAARYKHRIREIAEDLKLRRFVTLTLDPKKLGEREAVPYIRECWAKLRVYLRREFGDSPKYICVLEFQKNGLPHLHVLVDRFIPQEWIKETWENIGGGQHVDIRLVDLHRVSRYLSKYLTKELLLSAPKRCRRVTTSHGIHLNEKKADGTADLLRVPIDDLFEQYGTPNCEKDIQDGILQMFVCERLIL